MKNFSLVLLGFILLFPLGVATASDSGYLLGPGDKVRVVVFRHEDLSGDFEVNDQGEISLPLIRAIKVGGLTIAQTEEIIVNKLKPDYLQDPIVSVVIQGHRPFYVLGEVKRPGSYPYISGMTVMKAIASAGGFTYRAKKDEITVVRGRKADGEKRDSIDDFAPIYPDDVIEVPERFF